MNGVPQSFIWQYVTKKTKRVMNGHVLATRVKIGNKYYRQSIVRDISDQVEMDNLKKLNEARLEASLELNAMRDDDENKITAFALEKSIQITESKLGYLAFLDPGETVLTMHSWSKRTMDECKIVHKRLKYDVSETGLWGEAVRQRRAIVVNDYNEENELKKGTPAGHISILRNANIPVFDNGKIVMLIGLANKVDPYTNSDVYQVSVFLNAYWDMVKRKRAEMKLIEQNKKLTGIIGKIFELENDVRDVIENS